MPHRTTSPSRENIDAAMARQAPGKLTNLRVIIKPDQPNQPRKPLDESSEVEYINKWTECPKRLNVKKYVGKGGSGLVVVCPFPMFPLLPILLPLSLAVISDSQLLTLMPCRKLPAMT